jgi:hypothetical protein
MIVRRGRIAALAATALVAFAAAACADSAESPSPSAAPSRTAGAPSVTPPGQTPAVCPTPRPVALAALRYTAPRSGAAMPVLSGVAAAGHECADRITFTFDGAVPAYDIRYVSSWSTCGKGDTVTTQGPAQIVAQFAGANAHDDAGNPTAPKSLTPALASLKEAIQTCDFEADVSWVLGTEERYFTVATLKDPARVVVDIYH